MTPQLQSVKDMKLFVHDHFREYETLNEYLQLEEEVTREENLNEMEIRADKKYLTRFFSNNWNGCPVFSCEKCGWGIFGIVCATNEKCMQSGGSLLYREGFYERVWCSYVWKCVKGCGLLLARNFQCWCVDSDTHYMYFNEQVEAFGPPSNY